MQQQWVEAGQPLSTFWQQTLRSFVNTIAGAARRDITQAWTYAALAASASVGKLPTLDTLLTSGDDQRTGNAKLLSGLFKLKAKGVNMTVEKIERLH